MARDYKKEYANYHAKPAQKKNRALRNHARAAMVKRLGRAALEGKDVDHKVPLSKGGSNKPSNWRVRSISKNRSRKQ